MNRRQLGENNYRQKFEAFGLSEQFEFIRREWSKDHDKRFWSRCKNCGAEFLSYPEVFKGRQSRLICPECGVASDGSKIFARTKAADEAAEYYSQGHLVKETAERFGISVCQVNSLVRARRLTNGRSGATAASEEHKREGEERTRKKIEAAGFEYLGGYEGRNSRIRMRCIRCGNLIERTADSIRKGKTVCPDCKRADTRERQEQDRKKRALEAEQRAIEAEQRRTEMALKRDQKLDAVYVCKICGKEYTPREYMESAGLTLFSNVGYCSAACKRKKANRDSKACKKKRGVCENHRHRAKKFGCEYDPTVTLKKLIARDGLRCAICGELCDPNDRSWSEWSGPRSPSIDHIIPMEKGGGHIWSNVQVAHIICNSYKGNKV